MTTTVRARLSMDYQPVYRLASLPADTKKLQHSILFILVDLSATSASGNPSARPQSEVRSELAQGGGQLKVQAQHASVQNERGSCGAAVLFGPCDHG